ncbi:MAG: hypothetical protein COC01_02435 [Bacteroidetes bacterium]|nr:hypothetical protein [Bacteroidia bacterium]PCH69069.1 MAG: hypothetical protein COC01_02435 [Bacteroidota bacterium]
MKRTLLITALFLGFSVAGFSQTMEKSTGQIIEKELLSFYEFDGDNIPIVKYTVRDMNSGKVYESLPNQAQIEIGTYGKLYFSSQGHVGMGGYDMLIGGRCNSSEVDRDDCGTAIDFVWIAFGPRGGNPNISIE